MLREPEDVGFHVLPPPLLLCAKKVIFLLLEVPILGLCRVPREVTAHGAEKDAGEKDVEHDHGCSGVDDRKPVCSSLVLLEVVEFQVALGSALSEQATANGNAKFKLKGGSVGAIFDEGREGTLAQIHRTLPGSIFRAAASDSPTEGHPFSPT